jgi:hypothetical protein
MRRHLDPEVKYSTILFEGMVKWRANHLVETYHFDIYPGFTRLTIKFGVELIEGTALPIGQRDVVFDYDETRMSVIWTDRAGKKWRFSMSPDANKDISTDDMIGFLNYPLGALATITQEHMNWAKQFNGVMPTGMPRTPSLRIDWSHLEAEGRHKDVAAFMFTKIEAGMCLSVKLNDKSPLPVYSGADGTRVVSFCFSPDNLSFRWENQRGEISERGWEVEALGKTQLHCDILTDLMGYSYRAITGENEADIRGKAVNPVWRMVRNIDTSGLRPVGMPGLHG